LKIDLEINVYIIHKMVNYENGKIYKIVCNATGKQYIGSTTKTLDERLKRHWIGYLRFIQKKWFVCCSSLEILKGGDFCIHLIEECSCKTKNELLARERFYIENTECVNKNLPLRTKDEAKNYNKIYYEKNKEKLAEKHKINYDRNKEKILESQRLRYKNEAIARIRVEKENLKVPK
jgi:hypothetical protein